MIVSVPVHLVAGDTEANVVPLGIGAERRTLPADPGPALFTASVYVSEPPLATGSGASTSVSDRSAGVCCLTVVVTDAVSFVASVSRVEVAADTALVTDADVPPSVATIVTPTGAFGDTRPST